MSELNRLADDYLATWNEPDAERRAALLRAHWQPDARYVDPLASAAGHAEIGALIAAAQQRFAGLRFTLRGPVDGHGAHLRFGWSLGPADGSPAPIEGSDVVRMRDGRIAEVVGFLDKVPRPA